MANIQKKWYICTFENSLLSHYEISIYPLYKQLVMTITQSLKTEIYYALTDFLNAYKSQNTQVLAEKFGVSGAFLEEINETLDFVEDKNVLHLFPTEEIDKEVNKLRELTLYKDKKMNKLVVEACVYDDKNECIGLIVGDYPLFEHSPKFLFSYFDV